MRGALEDHRQLAAGKADRSSGTAPLGDDERAVLTTAPPRSPATARTITGHAPARDRRQGLTPDHARGVQTGDQEARRAWLNRRASRGRQRGSAPTDRLGSKRSQTAAWRSAVAGGDVDEYPPGIGVASLPFRTKQHCRDGLARRLLIALCVSRTASSGRVEHRDEGRPDRVGSRWRHDVRESRREVLTQSRGWTGRCSSRTDSRGRPFSMSRSPGAPRCSHFLRKAREGWPDRQQIPTARYQESAAPVSRARREGPRLCIYISRHSRRRGLGRGDQAAPARRGV